LNEKISDKDKRDWEKFVSSKEKLINKDIKFEKKKRFKVKHLDLHGYSLVDANKKITDYINYSYNNEISKLVVVTGKGLHSNVEKNPYVSKDLSILKYSIPEYINTNNELLDKILEIKDAKIEDGGSGAFYIFIKKKK
jgi:DNA-nicking Smr family endonuclease